MSFEINSQKSKSVGITRKFSLSHNFAMAPHLSKQNINYFLITTQMDDGKRNMKVLRNYVF